MSEKPDTPPADSAERLTGRERRALVSRGQRLKSQFKVGRSGLTDAVIDAIRQAFGNTDLLKVRIDADSAAETGEAGADIGRRVPCTVVQRVGRVVLLYRPQPTGAEE